MADNKPDSTIIAKLHDLLKLYGNSDVHYCPDKHPDALELKGKNPRLWKAIKHHCVFGSGRRPHGDCDKCIDQEAVFISIADQKASAISRRLKGRTNARDVYRVWRDEEPERGEDPGNTELVKQAFACGDLEAFYESKECRTPFEQRAETRQSSPFTSLRTHAELTGAWFEFFTRHADEFHIPDSAQDARAIMATGIMGKEVLLLRLKLKTHGRLARLKDLQIIREIVSLKEGIADALDGVRLYDLPDEVVVVALPSTLDQLDTLLSPNLTTNYVVDYAQAQSTLRNPGRTGKRGFLHNFGDLFGRFPRVIHPELKPEIWPDHSNEASSHAIICDLCQMAPATETRRDEKVDEYLCKSCYDMRGRAEGVDLFRRLEDDEGDPRVCLVKVSLDMAQLVTVLGHVFEERLEKKKVTANEEDLGFSILHEFVSDYHKFLEDFESGILALKKEYRKDNCVLLPGFIVVRTDEDNESASIVRLYERLYSERFRYLTGRELELPTSKGKPIFPIKLSVSCSPVKFPFLDHWDVLDNPSSAINVQSVRRATLSATFREFDALERIGIDDNRRVSSFLHNLAEVEARTQSMKIVKFTLLEKHRNAEAAAAPVMDGRVTVDQLLSYYKLFAQDKRP